jgi:hypothetical protein
MITMNTREDKIAAKVLIAIGLTTVFYYSYQFGYWLGTLIR